MTVRAAGGDVRTLPSLKDILDQQPNAVVAADRDGNLLYANAYAAALFGLPSDPSHLVGRSLIALGFEEGDAPRLTERVKQVSHGRPWEGTLAVQQAEGSRMLIRARAAALYDPAGEIYGISMVAREATMSSSRRERDRLRLLDRIGDRLARSL